MTKNNSISEEDLRILLSDDFYDTYISACDMVFNQINIIIIELSHELDRRFVHTVSKRVKTPASIYKKMNNKKLSLKEINDIAGIRVVVHNKKDAYLLLPKILKSNDITIIKMDDMIKTPKEDGYRSLHIQTEVDIAQNLGNKLKIPCEIQIRTIAQDLWATLSHRDVYKDIELPNELQQKMLELSNLLDGADSFAETLLDLIQKEKSKGKIPKEIESLKSGVEAVTNYLTQMSLMSSALNTDYWDSLNKYMIASNALKMIEKNKKMNK
jgi:putative GTP pyrophosphokinase